MGRQANLTGGWKLNDYFHFIYFLEINDQKLSYWRNAMPMSDEKTQDLREFTH
jgi:hypothetical protein